MQINQFPALKKACEHIAYDNGMINRFNPAADVLDEMFDRVRAEFSNEEIQTAENEMATFSEEELELACTDTENEKCPVKQGSLVDRVLNAAFGG